MLLTIVGVTGIINLLVVNQRAFLNFYYLPVVVGTYLLGLRKGVFAALKSCAIVFSLAFMNGSHDLIMAKFIDSVDRGHPDHPGR